MRSEALPANPTNHRIPGASSGAGPAIHPKCRATAMSASTTPIKIIAIHLDFLLIASPAFCSRLDTLRVHLSPPQAAALKIEERDVRSERGPSWRKPLDDAGSNFKLFPERRDDPGGQKPDANLVDDQE